MVEGITIGLFTAVLIGCILSGASILYALAAGYVIFCMYGLKKGYSLKQLLKMSATGVKTVKNILIIFLLIGMITALWRGAGTIPVIICYAAKLINPSAFLLLAFLLNCLVSVLTGTAFGTAATMGVICMSMASAIGMDPLYVGGAVVSGIFFGDRCSPVSTSALLVSELTKTNIFENIRRMTATAAVPFLLTCGLYLLLGIFAGGSGELMDVQALFEGGFRLHWILVLPAAMILIFSAFHVNVKITMAASILTASVLCLLVQDVGVAELFKMILTGYHAEDPQLSAMVDGGGIISMVRVAAIVCLSSSYAGIFEGTGLLTGMKRYIGELSRRVSPFGSILIVSLLTSMVACNQTLAIILTHQLCQELEPDHGAMAIHLENTVVVTAPLVPWSIAGAVPLATVAAPMGSLFFACYLYLVPLWNLAVNLRSSKMRRTGRLE